MAQSETQGVHQFNNITLGGKPYVVSGAVQLRENGVHWKAKQSSRTHSVMSSDIVGASWIPMYNNAAILKIALKAGGDIKFDGFRNSDLKTISELFEKFFSTKVDQEELATSGFSWGALDTENSALSFLVRDRRAFEVSLTDVVQASSQGRNDFSVELRDDENVTGEMLTEIRFHIPEDKEVLEKDPEALSEAQLIVQAIKDQTDAQNDAGEALCTFSEVALTVPRGRYDFDLYESRALLVGKTFEYKLFYENVTALHLLPKADGLQMVLVISCDPPLRQGGTLYPHLVLQFKLDEEIDMELELDAEMEKTFEGKLKKQMSGKTYQVFGQVFKTLTKRKLIKPAANYQSHLGLEYVKCSYKANEGHFYPLEKGFFFLLKPAMHISHEDIITVSFVRVSKSSASASSRSFDLKLSTKSGVDYQFGNISRNEYSGLFNYLTSKKLKIKNINDEGGAEMMDDMSDGIGDDDDESESEDGDFTGAPPSDESSSEEDSDDTKSGSSDDDESDSEAEKKKTKKKKAEKKKETKKKRKRKSDGDDSDAKSTPKKRKKKDKNAPKKALSAFMVYSQEHRAAIRAENPEAKLGDVAKLLGQKWGSLTADEKAKYEAEAKVLKGKYDDEMAEYKKNKPPTPSEDSDEEEDKKTKKGKGKGKGKKADSDDSDDDGKKKKKKPKKDPNAPKRPSNPFMLFANDNRDKMREENPQMKMGEIAKELGKKWASVDSDTKSKYEEQAKEAKEKYAVALKEYKQKQKDDAAAAEGGSSDDGTADSDSD
eukprot:GFYU01005140.1.p1 GENE.GFYU01005140.1~~GFYU01005140.1.p1  ORF type:complete len:771 (-),score=292.95 GFYU01005140.1:79-2391(-)